MRAKLYHIERLPSKTEKEIRGILRTGSDLIISILHEHFITYTPDDTDEVFEKVLVQVGKTISEVASLPELNDSGSTYKRISYLPGYTTKQKRRITHKVEWSGKLIGSDIAYEIKGKNESNKIKEDVTNQALLYHHLLEQFDDDKLFLNGGTHQFLVENAKDLETKQQYHVDLVKVFSVDNKKSEKDEITFFTIYVDFKKYNTVEKLYEYFNSELNKGIVEKRWPYNIEDFKLTNENKEGTYKMRGFLVALWYKILHDTNKKNIDKWFNDCVDLASENGFDHLKNRLEILQKSINRNTCEQYSFWYSLVFNPLPNFTRPNTIVETLGSAMIMANFELKPGFFFWIQPWINRMYRHIRDFENLENMNQEIYEEIKRNLKKKNKYFPEEVSGYRWFKFSISQKHSLPLVDYYEDYFSLENSENHEQPYINGIGILNNFALIKWIDGMPGSGDLQIDSIRNTHLRELGSRLAKKEFGSLLGDLEGNNKRATRLQFAQRLLGRFVSLGLYLFLNQSMKNIHGIVIGKQINPDLMVVEPETPYRMLQSFFFIDGMGKNDDEDNRVMNFSAICEGASLIEKEFLIKWHDGLEDFITESCSSSESLKEYVLSQKNKIIPPVLN